MVVSFGSAQGRLTGESRKVGIKSGHHSAFAQATARQAGPFPSITLRVNSKAQDKSLDPFGSTQGKLRSG